MSVAIVFDLDDTLYAERQFALGGFRAAARWATHHLGHAPDREASLYNGMVAALDRGVLGAMFADVLRAEYPSATEDDIKQFVRAYGQQTPSLTLFDDAERCINGPLAPLICGIITDGHAPTQQKKLGALGLDRSEWHILCTGALGPDRQFHKPHPRAFELVAARRPDVSRFVYVGDNVAKDFVAPNALGWSTVHVVRDQSDVDQRRIHVNATGEPPPGGAPHMTIASLDDLPELIAGLAT